MLSDHARRPSIPVTRLPESICAPFSYRTFFSGVRATDRPAPPPPLLQSFDDDWETLRAGAERPGHHSVEDTWWELETDPFAADASLESLMATGNPAVVERAGRCDVLLSRRVGAGEVVKELHLIPVSSGSVKSNKID